MGPHRRFPLVSPVCWEPCEVLPCLVPELWPRAALTSCPVGLILGWCCAEPAVGLRAPWAPFHLSCSNLETCSRSLQTCDLIRVLAARERRLDGDINTPLSGVQVPPTGTKHHETSQAGCCSLKGAACTHAGVHARPPPAQPPAAPTDTAQQHGYAGGAALAAAPCNIGLERLEAKLHLGPGGRAAPPAPPCPALGAEGTLGLRGRVQEHLPVRPVSKPSLS